MFNLTTIQLEMGHFFRRKYRLAMLALASFLALC
jgi:hypothetical protein